MYLFDEPPVTEDEVQEWLDRVPNLSASTFRREAYRKAYRVEEKIRAEKMRSLSTQAEPIQKDANSSS